MPRATRRPYQLASALSWLALASCTAPSSDATHTRPEEGAREATPPDTNGRDVVRVPAGQLTHDGTALAMPSFALDRTFVTRARFEAFALATGHVTAAEREGDGTVLSIRTGQWGVVPGADFRHPRGPSGEAAALDHPATQLSLADAEAFCTWAGGHVPSELEWEHAARNGDDTRSAYPWGDALYDSERARANTWEGSFPSVNTLRDGHLFVSPVDAFPPSPLGLRDIVGNVWHWTRSPFEGGSSAVTLRGGSHLCDPEVCHGHRIDARQRAEPTDRFAHVGVRCVYRDR